MEKVHAGVARSTFSTKNVQNTSASDDFWKLRCRKSARRCGAKHILSKNVQITACSGHFWKLRCRKSARRCGAKHILSKNVKITACSGHFWTSRCRPAVEKVHAIVARSTFPSQKCQKLRVLSHFLIIRWRFHVNNYNK